MIDYITLDFNSTVPKYIQIIDSIIHNISRGHFKIGDKMPSISNMSSKFYISRDTVERAYTVLKKKKVIVSVQGKGTYVAETGLSYKPKILFFVNKLSQYKMKVYNSFLEKMGDSVQVDLRSYHCDETLFLEQMDKHISTYDYFVIIPHFRTENLSHTNFTDKVSQVINKIPNEHLILLDNESHQIEGDFIEVFQDFENDIFKALEIGKEKIRKYNKLTLVYPKTSFYPYPRKIVDGFRRYCLRYQFDFEIVEEISNDLMLESKNLYITIDDDDLVHLMKSIKESDFMLGSDVGVISYNDTPLKQILGVTVISSDFKAMGEQSAKMIIDNKREKIKAHFYFMDRGSI